ncbi:O-antigen ligase family protein [Microlunatus capsulatus]|uniref:O-antigen ligase n=1 Tax=Microlunatus capsulatus TaxID=99117 RepID=A0ABS4ZCV6_9ACTN|nr:O-antigen ligase family protein [Microlunatus capsulatus]MBP2418565.1 O-antigen ligase [Microlunatus capsulatus]
MTDALRTEGSGPLGATVSWAAARRAGLVRSWKDGSLSIPARVFVVVYVFLLFCIPSQLVIRPLGAPGTPANLWGILALLWWLLATLGGRNPVRGFTPTRVSVGLLVGAVLASYVAGNAAGWYSPADIRQSTDELWTLVAVPADQLNATMISAADRGLLSVAGWAGVVLLASEGLRTSHELERVVGWVVGFGTFVAALGIVQYFTAYDIAALFTIPGLSANSDFGEVVSRSVLNRVSSTAVHPIEFGVLLAGVFLLALHRSLFAANRSWILRWLPTLVIGTALPMSVSRSAILALALACAVVFVGWPARWRIRGLLLAPLAVVGMRLVAPGLVGTIRSLFGNLGDDPSVTGRTADYSAVLGLYTEHPLLGRGLFTFVPRYYRILDNQMLMTLVELGAIGLAATLVFLGTGVYLARAARRRLTSERERHLALVLSASLVGVVLSYLTFDAWGFPMVAGSTFLLVGLAGAAHRLSLEPPLGAVDARLPSPAAPVGGPS